MDFFGTNVSALSSRRNKSNFPEAFGRVSLAPCSELVKGQSVPVSDLCSFAQLPALVGVFSIHRPLWVSGAAQYFSASLLLFFWLLLLFCLRAFPGFCSPWVPLSFPRPAKPTSSVPPNPAVVYGSLVYFCVMTNPLRARSWNGACAEGCDERDERGRSHADRKKRLWRAHL